MASFAKIKAKAWNAVAAEGSAATGTITCATKANLVDGETVTIDDGTNDPVIFEFDKTGDGVSGTNEVVDVSGATTAQQVAVILAAAINAVTTALTIDAATPVAGVIGLTNTVAGTEGNVNISDTVTHISFTHTGMSGGGGTLYSTPSNIGNCGRCSWQVVWTGTSTGTLTVQGSNDYDPATGTGDWNTVTATITSPSGSASSSIIQPTADNLGVEWVRLKYVIASGTGTLSAYFVAKPI